MATASSPVLFENVAELLERLGNIPPHRVRLRPPPGQATERDVVRILDHENRLCELVDGTLVEKTMGFREAHLAVWIAHLLQTFLDAHDLGIVAGADGTVRLLKGLVRIPDVAFVSWERLPGRKIPRKPIPDLAPDLAVEVLSKHNTEEEMERKLKEYFLAGVLLVWMVEPNGRTVEVFISPEQSVVLKEGDVLDGGEVLPGLRLPVESIFRRMPEPEEAPPERPKGKRRKRSSNG